MELIKNNWTNRDGEEFSAYLKTLSKGEDKSKWEQNILNTTLPCIAVPSKIVDQIVKEILKGNYLSFLNLNLKNNWTEVAIKGKIISKIKDFSIMKNYLDLYVLDAESWATTDVLKFKINATEYDNYFNLIQSYANSDKPFVRRTAIIIAFSFILKNNYDSEIYNILKNIKNENHYYVNMAVSWLICEYFIKRKDFALKILKSGILNDFTHNKAISKCRDSFRISKEDKEYLLTLKR